MAEYTVAEFFYRFRKQEPDVKVLVVEGPSDTKFWSLLAPASMRSKSTILPVDAVKITGPNNNGSKDRALELARLIIGTDLSERVKFFIDADNDHILEMIHPSQIILTDYRDVEGYVTEESELTIIFQSCGCAEKKIPDLVKSVLSFGKEIGILRAANDSIGAGLAITKTLERNSRRFFRFENEKPVFDRDRLMTSLFGGGASAGFKDEFVARYKELETSHSKTDPRLCVRGKDVSVIAAALSKSDPNLFSSSLRTCLLCNCLEKIGEPNLSQAYQHVV